MKLVKNNKVLQLGLLVVTLGIWSYAAYRFLAGGEDSSVEIAVPVIKKSKHKLESASYTLMANYPDPFLEDQLVMEQEVEMPIPEEIPKEIIPVVWPNLSYQGMISNNKTKTTLGLLTIDGKQLLLKAGSKNGDLKLEKLYMDSARFSFQGETKTLYTTR